MSAQRIEYIDAMRGFAMLLVVYYHIIDHCFNLKYIGFNNIFLLFQMPLFFFISGFVFYKPNRCLTFSSVFVFLSKKFLLLIVPAFFFWALFLYYSDVDVWKALGSFKLGYWFTFVLFIFFLFNITLDYILQGASNVWWGIMILLFFSFSISITSFYYIDYYPNIGWFKPVCEILDVVNWRYFIFFSIGIVIRKNIVKFIAIIDNKYLMALILCFFAISANLIITKNFAEDNFLLFLLSGLLGVIIIFSFFRKYPCCYSKNSKLGYFFQYVCRRTLDVYFLHFFFLPTNLNHIGLYLAQYSNPVLDLFLTLMFSLLLLCVVLVVSSIVRLSPFCAHYLFGVKNVGM